MYFYTLISGKILKKFWHVKFLHKMVSEKNQKTLKEFWHEKCLLIFNFFYIHVSFLTLCDFLGLSFSLCENSLRAKGKCSAFLNSAYQKTIRTHKKVRKN